MLSWPVRDFWEKGLPPCIQSHLECLRGWSVHNLLWQFVPVRHYSNAERMLAATGFAPLLVNLESMGAAKTASHGKSTRPRIILYMQIRSPRILLQTRGNRRSRWRDVSYRTWRSPFTYFSASFWTLSSAWQSRERMGEDACIVYSGCGRINALYKGSWRINRTEKFEYRLSTIYHTLLTSIHIINLLIMFLTTRGCSD